MKYGYLDLFLLQPADSGASQSGAGLVDLFAVDPLPVQPASTGNHTGINPFNV